MFDSLISAIQNGVEPRIVKQGGKEYVTKNLYIPPSESLPAPLRVINLEGLATYVNESIDGDEKLHLIVESPTSVKSVGSLIGRSRSREVFCEANCKDSLGSGFRFGEWYSLDEFIISCLSQFVQTHETQVLLNTLSRVTVKDESALQDDGLSQSVTTQSGITTIEQSELPQRIKVRPFRTFSEVDQPEIEVVLRLSKDGRGGVKVALFESDGGRWKVEAIASIRTYLAELLPDVVVIA